MRVDLNKSESVTVTLRSKGGGIIWIRSYAERSPRLVAVLCYRRMKVDDIHRRALSDHAIGLRGWACTDRKTYCECISWTGG